ncbi:MAG: hypothetical protein ACE15E_11360 [Acidobacteriota bacterium]
MDEVDAEDEVAGTARSALSSAYLSSLRYRRHFATVAGEESQYGDGAGLTNPLLSGPSRLQFAHTADLAGHSDSRLACLSPLA